MRSGLLTALGVIAVLGVLWLLIFTALATYDAVAGDDMTDKMWEMMGDMGDMDGMMNGMMGRGDSGPNTTGSASGTGDVRIEDFRFEPTTLTVTPGTVIRWTNEDSAPHTATGSGVDTGRLGRGESAAATFDERGTYEYICDFHPWM